MGSGPVAVQSYVTSATTLMSGACLVIEEGGQHRTIPLRGGHLTLGRAGDNDITLQSLFVSSHHAQLEATSSGHSLIDTNSTNGLLCNGRKAPRIQLKDGDVVRIGDQTTGNFVTLTYQNPLSGGTTTPPPAGRLQLTGAVHTIGRINSDLVLNHPGVSHRHAEVRRQANGRYLMTDLGSTNGTFVDGQRISQTPLQAGQSLQIGPYRLVFDGTSIAAHNQQGALQLDARGLNRIVRKGSWWRKQRCSILNEVSLSIAPREFVALVGGSGAGKSTLMGTLSGYAPATAGHVLINGDDYYHNFVQYQSMLGFVPQDDIIHRNLSVEHALYYAAKLRLPADTTPQEIRDRINRVLDEVGLTYHRDKLVDTLSGGQRKRVSIAAELLADPSLFFLDEPTSGLDPGLEKKMMYLLRSLADQGRTITLVTHATSNIEQCDHVAFMAAGRMVYFGPPRSALAFFGVGNDYADIYTRLDGVYDPSDAVHVQLLSVVFNQWQQTNPGAREHPPLAELWERAFRASPDYQQYVQRRLAPTTILTPSTPPPRPPRRISNWQQFIMLTSRLLELFLNDRRNLLILLLQAPLIAMLVNVVTSQDALVQNTQGARKVVFVLACVAVWFGIINAAREIAKEAPIYQRERLGGLRLLPYLLSKVAVLAMLSAMQSIALLFVVSRHLTLPAHGIALPVSIELGLSLFLTTMAGVSLGLLVSAVATTPDKAMSIVPLTLIPQILFAGSIFPLEGSTKVWSWLTISRWSMDTMGAIVDVNALPSVSSPPIPAAPNYAHSGGHMIGRWLVLIVYAVICLLVTTWSLRRRDHRV